MGFTFQQPEDSKDQFWTTSYLHNFQKLATEQQLGRSSDEQRLFYIEAFTFDHYRIFVLIGHLI